MIRLEGVSKVYKGSVTALREVSAEIQRGEFVFLVGPSGSGKSTFIRLLNREEVADSGRIMVAGKDIGALRSWKVPYLRREIGYIFQDYKLLNKKTVAENVAFGLEVIGRQRNVIRKQVPAILELVGLSTKAERFPDELSGGEQQMVAIGRALMSRPKVMLMDEPSMGLAPALVQQNFELIQQINEEGMAIFMVEQNANMALSIADRGWVLQTGRVVLDDTAEALMANPEMRSAYLGES